MIARFKIMTMCRISNQITLDSLRKGSRSTSENAPRYDINVCVLSRMFQAVDTAYHAKLLGTWKKRAVAQGMLNDPKANKSLTSQSSAQAVCKYPSRALGSSHLRGKLRPRDPAKDNHLAFIDMALCWMPHLSNGRLPGKRCSANSLVVRPMDPNDAHNIEVCYCVIKEHPSFSNMSCELLW